MRPISVSFAQLLWPPTIGLPFFDFKGKARATLGFFCFKGMRAE